MKKSSSPPFQSLLPKPASFHGGDKLDSNGNSNFHGLGTSALKRRGPTSRSWIQIDESGNAQTIALDKAALMKRCGLPSRDLRLLDPLFVYPSTILGRERAIVVSLEQVRCIITADEVLLMNSLDTSVLQYQSELCQRLQLMKDQNDDLPFEFKALELALELASGSLDAQVTELEIEVHPVLEELARSISTANLELVRRFKSHLLSSISHGNWVSRSAPASPTYSSTEQPERASTSGILSFSKHESSRGSSNSGRHIEDLEMLLEAYFVVADNTLSKLLSLKEYIDDTEDFINIKLDNVRNQLIQFELLLSAATFVVTIFAVVTGVFGMNFEDAVFDTPSNFNWVLILSSISCATIYVSFLLYVKYKKLVPL